MRQNLVILLMLGQMPSYCLKAKIMKLLTYWCENASSLVIVKYRKNMLNWLQNSTLRVQWAIPLIAALEMGQGLSLLNNVLTNLNLVLAMTSFLYLLRHDDCAHLLDLFITQFYLLCVISDDFNPLYFSALLENGRRISHPASRFNSHKKPEDYAKRRASGQGISRE